MVDLPRAVAAFVLALALSGCGGQGTVMRIDWDLSHGHTAADVHVPPGRLDAVDLQPIASVHIRFPGGRTFEGGEEIRDVGLEGQDGVVTSVLIFAPPRTAADAYELALRWAREWNLPREPIDAWYRQGARAHNVVAVGPPERTVGEGGPEPSIKLLASFDPQKPTVVSLAFDY